MKITKLFYGALLCALISCGLCGCNSSTQSSSASARSNDNSVVEQEKASSQEGAVEDESVQEEQAQDNVNHDKIVVIDFFATWCGPCKAMAPAIEQMKKKYGDVIDIKKIDVDEEPQLAQQYNITGVPTMVILSPQGEVIDKIVGAQPVEVLDQFFGQLAQQ